MEGSPARTMSQGPIVAPDRFREVMGRFATGVGVMTTAVDGIAYGMTVNAFSSVSLAPPLVLVCVERGTAMAEQVTAGRLFAVSFLASDQQEHSTRFADPARARGEGRFDGVDTCRAMTGAEILCGSVGWVDCRLWATYDGGDHLIVVGEVVDLGTDERHDPLVYHRSRYATVEVTGPHDEG